MEHLTTLSQLEQNALAKLGVMAEGSHADFEAKAAQVAAEKGVRQPQLVVALVYHDSKVSLTGLKETPYRIAEDEWALFVSQTSEYLESSPVVYVVDGAHFTALG